ncbi:MAG: hypothetical protein JW941_13010 [Candidatus Coatesbacteria bacterium]|nr:hypothetical protein [Candidatus Coatesbacteria bacterium]
MNKRDVTLTVICLFAFIYTSVWVHVYLNSRAELLRGDALKSEIPNFYREYAKLVPLKSKDLLPEGDEDKFEKAQYDYFQSVVKATTAYDNCLHSYTPFSKYLPKAAEALIAIGDDCFNQNEFHLALSAYRTVSISPDPVLVQIASDRVKKTYDKMEFLQSRMR